MNAHTHSEANVMAKYWVVIPAYNEATTIRDVASRAIYESVFEAVHDGKATTDLGGRLTTTEFTDEVICRIGTKLEVWSGLRG